MKHLLSAADLSRDAATAILDDADKFREALLGRDVKKLPTLRGRTVITMFYENSTRTRVSFEVAGKWMSADVINVSSSGSSVAKGESLRDTALTLRAAGADALIIRHPASGAAQQLAAWTREERSSGAGAQRIGGNSGGPSVINAGDGTHELDRFVQVGLQDETAGADGQVHRVAVGRSGAQADDRGALEQDGLRQGHVVDDRESRGDQHQPAAGESRQRGEASDGQHGADDAEERSTHPLALHQQRQRERQRDCGADPHDLDGADEQRGRCAQRHPLLVTVGGPVDEAAAEEGLQRLVDLLDIDALFEHLVTVDVDEHLRRAGDGGQVDQGQPGQAHVLAEGREHAVGVVVALEQHQLVGPGVLLVLDQHLVEPAQAHAVALALGLDQGLAPVRVAVNVSGRQILHDYPRRAHLEFYRRYPDPFYGVTFELEVTNLRSRLRGAGRSTYAGLCWAFHRALLGIDAFRVRLEHDAVVLHDSLRIGVTVPAPRRTFSFTTLAWHPDPDVFFPAAAAAMARAGLTPDWTAASLGLHIQAVIQGAFILAKASGGAPDGASKGARLAGQSLDHLHRYLKLLLAPGDAPATP